MIGPDSIIGPAKDICREDFHPKIYRQVARILDHDEVRAAVANLVKRFAKEKVTPELIADLAFHCVWCRDQDERVHCLTKAQRKARAMDHLAALKKLQADARPMSSEQILFLPYAQRQALAAMIEGLESIAATKPPAGRSPGGQADRVIYDLGLTFLQLFGRPCHRAVAAFASAIFGNISESQVKDIAYLMNKGRRNIP